MRVLHVMAGAKEGGAENIMLESVLALAEAGVEQAVVTRTDNQFRIRSSRRRASASRRRASTSSGRSPTRAAIATRDARVQAGRRASTGWAARASSRRPRSGAKSIGWYGGYYKLARFTNCEWHVGLTQGPPAPYPRTGRCRTTVPRIVHTYAEFAGVAARRPRRAEHAEGRAGGAGAGAAAREEGPRHAAGSNRQDARALCLDRRRRPASRQS